MPKRPPHPSPIESARLLADAIQSVLDGEEDVMPSLPHTVLLRGPNREVLGTVDRLRVTADGIEFEATLSATPEETA